MAQFIDRQAIVRINRVRAIDDIEGTFRGEADFFPVVTVDGRSFSKPDIDDDDDISPPDWVFGNQVSERLVPITISIRESDGGSFDTADINPASGRKELNLLYDMVTGQVRDADTNEVYASSEGQVISLEGAGDDDRAAIEFSIVDSTNPNLPENALLLPPLGGSGISDFGDIRFRGNSLAAGDFNNDGKDELVVGAFSAFLRGGAIPSAGAIHVYQGTETGPSFASTLSQDNLTFGTPEESEHFGASVVTGNFDGDEFDDVVVGVPFDKVNGVDAGAIHAIYGSASGLNGGTDDRLINQGTGNFASDPLAKEAYGNVLAVADFNKDGRDDLVVGVPFDKRGNNSVGGVNVIYGSPTGLTETVKRDQFYNQSVSGMPGLDDNLQGFGEALAVGDFNSDGNMDLAIGVPGDTDGGPKAGVVDVIFGTRDGLPSDRDVTGQVAVLSQALSGISAQSGDEFGKALAVGDFNGDGEDDIAIGAPGRSNKAGVVYIYEGQQGQKKFSSSPKIISQGPGLGSTIEIGDRFSAQLAAADMNGDGIDDLVISAPGEDNETGVAHLLFGSRNNGITTNGNRLLRQGDGVGGTADESDRFGTSLAIGNFDGQGRSEIAASVPGEAVGLFTEPVLVEGGIAGGAVNIINPETLGIAGVNGMSVVKSTRSTTNLQGGDVDGILRGNQRNNRLSTGGGGDIALGMGGNDILNGQTGDDLLDGGKGKDRYIGGEGHDTFVISHKNGKAIIRDFEDKIDQIGLAHGLDFEDLTLKKRGRHTEIRLDDQSLALVRGTRPAQLNANDFVEVDYNRLQGMLVPSVVV